MFITLEGCEGAGKTTLMQSIAEWFSQKGHDVVATREPGGTVLGQALRSIVVDKVQMDIVPPAELFLYMADRAQHVAEVIKPALAQGCVVISDRYIDSTIAYQGYARGLSEQQIQELCTMATGGLLPDHTLVLDLDPAIGLERVVKRLQKEGNILGKTRYEEEALEFHQSLRNAYLKLAEKDGRYVVFNAEKDLAAVREDVLRWLASIE